MLEIWIETTWLIEINIFYVHQQINLIEKYIDVELIVVIIYWVVVVVVYGSVIVAVSFIG